MILIDCITIQNWIGVPEFQWFTSSSFEESSTLGSVAATILSVDFFLHSHVLWSMTSLITANTSNHLKSEWIAAEKQEKEPSNTL